MRDNESSRPTWRFFDGAVSISVSMLLAVLLGDCEGCGGLPLLGYLKLLTERDDGIIIVATLLLFPTSMAFYGGMVVFFAARETVKAWSEKRDMKRREEWVAGRAGRRSASVSNANWLNWALPSRRNKYGFCPAKPATMNPSRQLFRTERRNGRVFRCERDRKSVV